MGDRYWSSKPTCPRCQGDGIGDRTTLVVPAAHRFASVPRSHEMQSVKCRRCGELYQCAWRTEVQYWTIRIPKPEDLEVVNNGERDDTSVAS